MDRLNHGAWRIIRLLSGLVLLFVLTVSAYAAYLLWTVVLPSAQTEQHQPLRIYAAPFGVVPGLDLTRSSLVARLHRLGYQQKSIDLDGPGQYLTAADHVDVYLDEPSDGLSPQPIRLLIAEGRVERLETLSDHTELPVLRLPAPLISGIVGQPGGIGQTRIRRAWLPLPEIPRVLIDAVLAVEDHRFYRHTGVDPVAIARALWENLGSGRIVQGGSTITQQLAKNLYFSSERTYLRKLREAVAAFVLEHKYSKDAILEAYLNEIYFGQVGSVALYGVSEAARFYFDKPVQDLTLTEAALLAGLIKAPNLYSPLKDMAQAKRRRDLVFHRLHANEGLNATELAEAVRSPVRVAALQARLADAPYFVDYVLREYEAEAGEGPPLGARLYSTLDTEMQRTAEEAVGAGLARLESRSRHLRRSEHPLQAALVALDPATGAVRAMVGGRDYRDSQFNRAVQARRQAGSLFKPFIYLAAFEQSILGRQGAVTAATLIEDAPLSLPNGRPGPDGPAMWSPQNYDRKFHGEVTVRAALEQSLNIPAVRVAQQIGIARVARTLHDFGITEPLQEDLSLALGSAEVSLLEMTGAFAALANGGVAVHSTGIERPAEAPFITQRVASPQAAYLVTSLLEGVVTRGTASAARGWGLDARVAGKTGTTDDHRDAWFIGYTPELAVGVWVGFDDGESLHLTGSQAALPIWVEFARRVLSPADSSVAVLPPGIVERKIDPRTGLLATSSCPEVVDEVFIEGTEPADYCHVHAGLLDRLKHLFGL